ncbi:MAG: ATP-dependent Clp protease ATP-binding subunit, partial [Saprospiraceae bacterium]|nr:ATP-dependent Clp protease ATP-binding subunit [Saprospiraceae bacterium]
KVLAEFMFGSRDRLTRFDMSEYSSAYDVMRLTGLSFRNDGLLTSAVRREPFCVLLFDEIEKAHSDFSDLLLQILGEGRLTDSRGKLVNFCSCIVIMTSNIGASKMQGNRISLKKELDTKQVTEHFLSAVRAYFRPELFNRIDQVIPFEPLSRPVVRQVVDRELQLLQEREGIRFRRMHLQLAPEVYDYLAEHGYHAQYGARHLQRIIRERLIVPLARALNAEDFDDQLVVTVAPDGEKLRVEVEADPLGLELLFEELEKI